MINLARGIDSLTNFKRDTSRFVTQLKKTGEPVVLTVNGKAELVVQNAASYQALLEQARAAENVKILKKSLAQARRGKVKPLHEALDTLQKKLNIPDVEP